MFERIHIENYKCLVDFALHLDDTTLLLGANGTGKTAVLDVVYGIRKLLTGEAKVADPVAFPASSLTRWQTHRHQQFRLRIRVADESFTYALRVEHEEGGSKSRITRERLLGQDRTVLFDCKMGEVQLYRDDGSTGPTFLTDWHESALARVVEHPANTRLTSFLKAIRRTVVCTIRPDRLRTESTREDPILDRAATNFVDWYRHAIQENPMRALPHVNALRPVLDGFNDLQLRQAGLDSRALMLRFGASISADDEKAYRLRFSEIADGQRALVVLYGLVHLSRGAGGIMLFLDEPDNYVALPEIQPWLLELVELCEETPSQAVICSHHPELIDYFGIARGRVLRRNASGAVTPHSLDPPPAGSRHKLSELVARGWDN